MNRIFTISLLLVFVFLPSSVFAAAVQVPSICPNAVFIIGYSYYNNTMGSGYVKCDSSFDYPYCNFEIVKTSDGTLYKIYNASVGNILNFPSSSYTIRIYGYTVCSGGGGGVPPQPEGSQYYEVVYSNPSVTSPTFTCPSYCDKGCKLNQTTIYVSGSGYVTANPPITRDTCSMNEVCNYGAGSYHPAFEGYCFITPPTPSSISSSDILSRIEAMFTQLLCWIKGLFGGGC